MLRPRKQSASEGHFHTILYSPEEQRPKESGQFLEHIFWHLLVQNYTEELFFNTWIR